MGWRDGQIRNRARNRDFSGSEMGLNKSGRQLSDATYGFSLGPTLATISLYLHVEPQTFGSLGKSRENSDPNVGATIDLNRGRRPVEIGSGHGTLFSAIREST